MKLKIKPLKLTTGGTFVAVLNKKDAAIMDLYPGNRIKIKSDGKEITSVIDLTEESVNPGEIGLFNEILNNLDVKRGYVEINIAEKLSSVYLIRKKLDGKKLNKKEINEIVKDIVNNNLSEVELTYFVSGCYANDLDYNEITNLTRSIVNNGNRLGLDNGIILDKHSIGGIPGNRTSMIVVPIIAAAGYKIPKTSSRSITSPSGTSDTMEVLSEVSFPVKEIKKIVKKTNGCLVWGGAVNLASADDKLIRVRNPISLDPEGMLLASIIAKKAAVNATHVLIDIPAGKGSKISDKKDALRLKNKFIMLANNFNMEIKVMFSDGRQPIGNGIGPALEAIDVLHVLQGGGSETLREKSLKIASLMLEMAGEKNTDDKASNILDSGLAYEKMKEIIEAQNGNPNIKTKDIKIGPYKYDVNSNKSGIISAINNNIISKIARISGAPNDKSAGIYLNVHLNDFVKKNATLFTIYSKNREKLEYAVNLFKIDNPVLIK